MAEFTLVGLVVEEAEGYRKVKIYNPDKCAHNNLTIKILTSKYGFVGREVFIMGNKIEEMFIEHFISILEPFKTHIEHYLKLNVKGTLCNVNISGPFDNVDYTIKTKTYKYKCKISARDHEKISEYNNVFHEAIWHIELWFNKWHIVGINNRYYE